MRAIINPKLIFCKDHNLLIYSKSIISTIKIIETDNESLSFDESSNESNDVDDINDSMSFFR